MKPAPPDHTEIIKIYQKSMGNLRLDCNKDHIHSPEEGCFTGNLLDLLLVTAISKALSLERSLEEIINKNSQTN